MTECTMNIVAVDVKTKHETKKSMQETTRKKLCLKNGKI